MYKALTCTSYATKRIPRAFSAYENNDKCVGAPFQGGRDVGTEELLALYEHVLSCHPCSVLVTADCKAGNEARYTNRLDEHPLFSVCVGRRIGV